MVSCVLKSNPLFHLNSVSFLFYIKSCIPPYLYKRKLVMLFVSIQTC